VNVNDTPRFAKVNGIRVAYDRFGEGFPLVALHGFPRNRKVWSKITPILTSRFTVLAADRRGYGDSDRPADPATYDNATMARDVVELVDQLGWDSFVVLGHDKGAPTAQRLAKDLPDRVRGLIILDAAPSGSGSTAPRDPSGRSWYFDFFRQRGVAEQLIGQNPRLFFSLFLDRNPHLSREEHEYYLETFCRPGSVEAVLADYRVSLEDDRVRWEEEAATGVKIRVPVCALWGARGPSTGSPILDRWREAADDVRGAPIPDAAHYVQEEQPQLVAAHILQFADELGITPHPSPSPQEGRGQPGSR
jgi:haloacetate dehalogenase